MVRKPGVGVLDTVDAIARRAVDEASASPADSDVVRRVSLIVREFATVVPMNPDREIRDRVDDHLFDIASRLGRPGLFDGQRGWLYGLTDTHIAATMRTAPPLGIVDVSSWQRGYEQGVTRGREAQGPGSVSAPGSLSQAPHPSASLSAKDRKRDAQLDVFHRATWKFLVILTSLTAVLWFTAVRSDSDRVIVLLGAVMAIISLVLFYRADRMPETARRLGWNALAFVWALSVGVGGAITARAFATTETPHAPLGDWVLSVVWLSAVLCARLVTVLRPRRSLIPDGRFIVERATHPSSAGEIGIVGLFDYAFSGFIEPFGWSRRTSRVEFWVFLTVGLPLGVVALVVGWSMSMAWLGPTFLLIIPTAMLSIVGVWLALALIGVTARRLFDARFPSALALWWLAVPALFGLVVLVAGDSLIAAALTISLVASVLVMVAVGSVPTRGEPGNEVHSRFSVRVVRNELLVVLEGIKGVFYPLRSWLTSRPPLQLRSRLRSLLRVLLNPNRNTALLLFGAFVLFVYALAEPAPADRRLVFLTLIALGWSAVHITRWVLQERYFATSRYVGRWADGKSHNWKHPHWQPGPVRVHKVLGLVWMWAMVAFLSPVEDAINLSSVQFIVFVGYALYLTRPFQWVFAFLLLAFAAVPLFGLALGGIALAVGGTMVANIATDVFFWFFVCLYILWGVISVMWFARELNDTPTDARTRQFRGYWKARPTW